MFKVSVTSLQYLIYSPKSSYRTPIMKVNVHFFLRMAAN